MRLIDTHKLLYDIETNKTFDIVDIVESIIMSPTVDAVPVIRCKDCKYYRKDRFVCDLTKYACTENDFCSWAEREEHETD